MCPRRHDQEHSLEQCLIEKQANKQAKTPENNINTQGQENGGINCSIVLQWDTRTKIRALKYMTQSGEISERC